MSKSRFLTFLVAVVALRAQPVDPVALLRQAFERPPAEARILMRWWWFGPAVTRPELEREMRLMKEGGIGGFEVQPVYPLALDDPAKGFRNFPYLSPQFLEALRFTAGKARELGLRMDLTLGSGWPYGGPHIPITQAAGRLRIERVRVKGESPRVAVPDIARGEKLLAAFAAGSRRELGDIRDGVLWLPVGSERPNEVWFFIASRTGMMVKRPAIGAEGFVLDHYDGAAIENHLKNVAEPMIRAMGSLAPYAVFCDSLEVYGSDWTADFLEQFHKRRGYDLKPHLPALAADNGVETLAVRHDWGKTLTQLYDERFVVPLSQWARARRTRLRIQNYGIPPAAISSYAAADLPEGEGAQWKTLSATRWASSASHLYGRPVTSSETWTWLHSPSFRATPLDVKAEADRHFLQGINQLIGHGWPYTADGVEYPGWRFYAAAVFDEKNPWWIVMPDLALYLQRVSFLLRQGTPANDVAVYLSTSDAWAHFTPARVNLRETLSERLGRDLVARILDAGYGLDFFDDGTVDEALRANRHRIVVLPGVETMPAATLRKLDAFARAGGKLVATHRLPSSAPGLMASEAEKTEVRETARRLFEDSGRLVTDENQLGATLAALLDPDLSLSPAAPEIGFVHRSAGAAEIYFLANTGNTRRVVKATFRVAGMTPEWWDPITGNARPARIEAQTGHTATLALELEPYSSIVVVFWRGTPAPEPRRSGIASASGIDLSTGWQVTFGNVPPVKMDRLHSWTDDEATRYYSGVATYERDIVVPEILLKAGLEMKLDFGEGTPVPEIPRRNGMQAWLDAPVREAAVVYINDQRAGAVWCPPYSVDATGFVRSGRNRLRIAVANLATNYMAGHALPDYRLLNLRYGVRFEPQDMDQVQPVPAGLLGGIRLIFQAGGSLAK